jgi:uncharacterized damage-inducible protein DinB
LTDVPPVVRGALHALELAQEDLQKFCAGLTEEEVNARPAGLAPIAFHLRHIARSLDRLLTYAEGRALTPEQLIALKSEFDPGAVPSALFEELSAAFNHSSERLRALAHSDLGERRSVGKKSLPTTVGGLLVHVADHTQRHVGQAITTAKLLLSQRQ